MEALEKPKTRNKKKQTKQKHDVNKTQVVQEPVGCSSKHVDVSEELQSAANDIEESCDAVQSELKNGSKEIVHDKTVEECVNSDLNQLEDCIKAEENGTNSDVKMNEMDIKEIAPIESQTMNENIDVKANAPILEQKIEKEKKPLIIRNHSLYSNAELLIRQLDHSLNFENPKFSQGTIYKQYPEVASKKQEPRMKAYTENQLAALYTNAELNTLEQFTIDFVESELKSLAIKNHPLYELLSSYVQARSKVVSNNLEMRQIRRDYEELQDHLWTLNSSVVAEKGLCSDGQSVTATHTFTKATFHRSTYQSIIRMLGKIRELTNEAHSLYTYTASVVKLQIELYIQNIIMSIISITQLNINSPVYLGMQSPPQHILPYIQDLRLCISVLFQFQRKLIRDPDFIKESREWLSQLVFLLLRLATWQDHLFILNHVLRCPPGIGSWASVFIQIPIQIQSNVDPFTNFEINHVVSTLAMILMPIEKREIFLHEISQQKEDAAVEALWVIVDSDGEEDEESSGTSLRENDLVALLNQLPLDDLFRSILLIQRKNDKDVCNHTVGREYHILKFFSFSTILLKIFQRGLKTYDLPRYHQFCKRLSRFIRHVVQYATDELELLQSSQHLKDEAMIQRLQVEYDSFFLRAIYYLYSSEKLGAWQFLAVVPYNLVSKQALWKIFYFLHELDSKTESILDPIDCSNYTEVNLDVSLREQFEEKLASLAEDECYYLLNTFANMALARGEGDMNFIYSATMDLLQIGFISKATQDTCSKNVRILLTHITSKHPHLLSDILKSLKENMANVGELCLYLYEELPISIWRPTDIDIETISNWLLKNPITADESKLARMILSRLNWELVNENTLFLPHSMHCKIAVLIAKAVEVDQGYLHWAWQTAVRLRLHINEKGFTNFQDVKDIEIYDVIYKGVRDHQPLASFLSVLISSWGHLIPLVVTRGMDQLLFLQINQKHEAVLFALNLIVPLFIECQESLINDDKFQTVLLGLLNADRTYISIAKSFMAVQTTTILEQFGNMIESQIANFAWYNCSSPRYIVRLWANSLVSIPNWNRDYGVMYLLNVIIKASFFDSNSMDVIVTILRDLLQVATPQEQSNSISSLFKWVSHSTVNQNLLINTSLSTCPYLAFVMIDLEFEERERSSGLWNEILVQLNDQKGKVNVDAAIKKAAHKLKLGSFSSGSLCIFRWAQQALDTDVDHPILGLLWQKFFLLYLYRVPLIGTTDRGCVGHKFFDGVINFNFLKRMKRRLNEAVDYYQGKTTESDFALLPAAKQLFFMSGLKLFRAYSLWLEEPRLRDSSLHLPGLPPQYEPQLLNLIMQCSDSPWIEYVDYSKMKEEQAVCIKLWRSANYRERKNINQPLKNAGKQIESDDPWERIIRRLASYDTPKKAPPIQTPKSLIPTFTIEDRQSMFSVVDSYLKTLLQFAHNHALNVSEQKELDCGYQELLPQLYRSVMNTVKKSVPCFGVNKTVNCSGAALITIQTQEARINSHIEHQIQLNRRDFETLLAKLLQSPSQSLCIASVVLQQVICTLQGMRVRNPETSELGVELFYYILSLISEEVSNYLPTKKLFTECLEKIGQSHINGIEFETPKLLNKILEDPLLGMYLAPHFSPVNVGTANFLLMYSMITKGIGHQYDLLCSLLSKFDVNNWLQKNNPKLSQRSQFIELIIQALLNLGQEPAKEAISLHKVYRKHLLCVFTFQFPEHYGEILMSILKASNGETDCIASSVWFDVLHCLSAPVLFELNKPMREQLRTYAQTQQLLHYQELLETSMLLSRHFTNERLQYGLYGLYPKARNYIHEMVLLLGMTGHSLLISALNTHQGVVGNKLCEIIWPYLRDMFAPWIVPYCTNDLKDNMATWIQQLTDDRAVLLPWTSANAAYAQKIVNIFFECILYIIQTLPACNNILSIVWHWYVSNFAHTAVKDHILNVIHHSFISLPWQKFWPTIVDLELMLKVAEQYLPDCHTFLGHIFMEVPWNNWMICLSENATLQNKCRVHHCLLSLLIKLSNEPNIRNNCSEKLKTLLVQAENFDWCILEISSVQQAMDWYVMSCDSQVIFKTDPLNLDFRVLQFLKMVSFYTKPLPKIDQCMLEKRHIFVRSFIKLIVVFSNRHKTVVPAKENELVNVINSQLNHLEMVVNSQHEFNVILGDILTVLNQSNIKNSMLKCFEDWVSTREGDGMAVKALLDSLGAAVGDAEAVAVLYESSIMTYFKNNVSNIDKLSWDEISVYLKQSYPKPNILTEALIERGCILTLHMILLQKMENPTDLRTLLNLPLQWLSTIKVNEGIENKVPLLWYDFLDISLQYCTEDEVTCGAMLHKFSQCLLIMSEQKEALKWGGILGAIGIGKQSAVSLQFRFLCKAVAGYVLAQLPDAKGNLQIIRTTANAPCTVGQSGGNSEVVKVLLKLDFGQNQGKIKDCAEQALKQIQDPANSLHNVKSFLSNLLLQITTEPFLKDIR